MRIDSLTLENFRGFAQFTLDLHPEVTVLVGKNATGKTALLDALAVALGAWLSGMANARAEDRTLTSGDARLVRRGEVLFPTLEYVFPVRVGASGVVGAERVDWARELRHRQGRTTTGETQRLRQLAIGAEQKASSPEPADLFLLAYYGTGRLWVEKRARAERGEQLASRFQGYRSALEPASDPKLFEAWMRWREEDYLQRIARASETGRPLAAVERSPHLQAVEAAACACLEGASRFYYNVNYKELRVEMADGTLLPFHALSDGQRSLVAMAADIAWRAVQLNPHLGKDAPKLVSGVVLIDEIELHLHPAWQRRVIGDLRRAFPKLQFVVTTHSPQVIASCEQAWIRLLVPGADRAFPAAPVHGRDSNAILRDVMGVPPRAAWMQKKLDGVSDLIEAGEVAGATALLAEVKADLGADDEAVLGLEWELHDLEVNGAPD
ncbi:MAG: AAA family ATPase [Myxococcota bacterium]